MLRVRFPQVRLGGFAEYDEAPYLDGRRVEAAEYVAAKLVSRCREMDRRQHPQLYPGGKYEPGAELLELSRERDDAPATTEEALRYAGIVAASHAGMLALVTETRLRDGPLTAREAIRALGGKPTGISGTQLAYAADYDPPGTKFIL